MKKMQIRELTLMGLLLAVEIVLSRFCSISAWNIKIGFAFLPVAAAAILLGPAQAGIVAGLGDFLGALLFPVGPYFPGFTLTAFLTGVILGMFLHRKQSGGRILGAVAVNQLVLSLLLNSLWIALLYDAPYGPLLATRVVQCAVLAPLQWAAIGVLTKPLSHYRRALA